MRSLLTNLKTRIIDHTAMRLINQIGNLLTNLLTCAFAASILPYLEIIVKLLWLLVSSTTLHIKFLKIFFRAPAYRIIRVPTYIVSLTYSIVMTLTYALVRPLTYRTVIT